MSDGKNIPCDLEVYRGEERFVIVYDTYAKDHTVHFDVFIPTGAQNVSKVPEELDALALEAAREFLSAIGVKDANAAVIQSARCHLDRTSDYEGALWQLPGKDVYIWPLEGCPRPAPAA